MLIGTDSIARLYVSDEYTKYPSSLVVDVHDSRVSIYQASDNEETNNLLDAADDSIELDIDEAVQAFEILIRELKEVKVNGNTLPAKRILFAGA